MWWIARNSIKPLASKIDNIYQARISHFTSFGFEGKPRLKSKDSFIDWYKKDDKEEWIAAKEYAAKKQKELNEKQKNGQ